MAAYGALAYGTFPLGTDVGPARLLGGRATASWAVNKMLVIITMSRTSQATITTAVKYQATAVAATAIWGRIPP